MIGICQWCLPDRGPKGLAVAAEMGYHGVELDIGLGRPEIDLRIPAVRDAFADQARQAGVAFTALALNGICMNDAKREAHALEIIDAAIEAAHALGISRLQMPSFFGGGIHNEEEFASTVRCLQYACHAARPYAIAVGTENQLDTAGNLRILQEVNEPELFVYFDTANPIWLDGHDNIAMLRDLLPYIRETHVKDLLLDGTNTYRPLGQGDCRFMEAAALLKDFTGWIVAENELPYASLAQDAQTLKTLFSH